MNNLATVPRIGRVGSSTGLPDKPWRPPESSAPTDTPLLIRAGQGVLISELFGTEGQSLDLFHRDNYATVVYMVDLSHPVVYDPMETKRDWQDSVTTWQMYLPSAPDQFSVDVLLAEASSEGVLAQSVPVSDLDESDLVAARLDELLALGHGYVFRDGMHSPFSRSLVETINAIGFDAFGAIEGVLSNNRWPPPIAGEAMRWIGDMDAPETLLRRINLLALALRHESFVVREGAVLGLMYAGSREGIEILERALEVETHPLVKLSIEETLAELGGLES